MSQCPYPETIIDQSSCEMRPNRLYLVWHEGYEAHKFEIANLSIRIAHLAVELENENRKIKQLKSELEERKG
jgi:predicted RNase H-like nuclease (RuvC/YqgF family)